MIRRRRKMYLTVHVTETLSMKPGKIAQAQPKTRALQSELYQISFFVFFSVAIGYLESWVQSPETQQDICRRHQWSVTEIFQAGQRCAAPYLCSKTWTPTWKINWRIYFGARGWKMSCATFGLCIPNTPTRIHTKAAGTSATALTPGASISSLWLMLLWWHWHTDCHHPCKRNRIVSVKWLCVHSGFLKGLTTRNATVFILMPF